MLIFCLCSVTANKDLIDMKIVDEPSSYGFNNMNNNRQWGAAAAQEEKLKMRVKPSNVSGPVHLTQLAGRCFRKILENYKYEFCPFSNITQHEQGYHWNPFKGILGVWQEWEIENNTFVAMEMKDGDDCGQIHRSIKVRFLCGNTSDIISVREPQTCHYKMEFSTPLVCHPHSLLVYPILSSDLRKKWDILEGQYRRLEITYKGYKKRLEKIFQEAGLRLTLQQRQQFLQEAKATEEKKHQDRNREFYSLGQCTQEYRRLQEEMERLRLKLATYEGGNGTDVSHNSTIS
ncbi:hypothetical protein C0Q70_00550 [Pomacea canaliculata]|uniref:Uncharacterized protein n=1 Tax=Pomacea canaliculata TaxID=400727 RepID=A0A2T7PX14_POMCA|nr:hypothetical protein C0Q70_00550 [Pomacea canaliculata]